MRERIVQLTATDFQEAVDLINYAFSYSHGPHDVLSLLPKVYQPTDQHMGCNHAIRRDGRLVAIAGVFPLTWSAVSRSVDDYILAITFRMDYLSL